MTCGNVQHREDQGPLQHSGCMTCTERRVRVQPALELVHSLIQCSTAANDGLSQQNDHRIIESFKLEKTLISLSPTINLAQPSPPLSHVPKHHVYTSFKYLQGWRLNHFPGQPVPMLDHPFSEVKFPHIQSKPPLAQLEAISSRPITCYLGEETDPTSLQPPFRQL
ncbi:hypothetical protein QYF61_017597 [Mycteria americana]|uniref:Uncharacterized protein n=1 Tax=Mycteria americana TaxID=33587 RepID=A0AAN7N036_MYCAM|nr:hypothetical protein QYF61_017597 [Mycteria americana]